MYLHGDFGRIAFYRRALKHLKGAQRTWNISPRISQCENISRLLRWERWNKSPWILCCICLTWPRVAKGTFWFLRVTMYVSERYAKIIRIFWRRWWDASHMGYFWPDTWMRRGIICIGNLSTCLMLHRFSPFAQGSCSYLRSQMWPLPARWKVA